MEKSQKSLAAIPSMIAIVAVLAIAGGVYFYETKIKSPTSTNIQSQNNLSDNTSSAICEDFTDLSDYVLKNIQQPDGQNAMEANKNVITSFRWKRKSGEPFITYPIVNGVRSYYGDQQTNRSRDFVVSAIKNNSDALGKTIDEKAKNLGLIADPLNTLPFQSFLNQDIQLRAFAFRGGDNLYSITLKAEGGGNQALPVGVVTVACGKAVNEYDSVYNALNFKADTTVQNTYDNDYVAIADISSDNKVYALLGSSNHIKIANYYYFNGNTAKLVSKDNYPTQCVPLESQKVGKGMRCIDTNYNHRTVNYSSASTPTAQQNSTTSNSPAINVAGMKQYTDPGFGFLFYYPSSWTMQNSATRNSYTGGNVQKTLTITPPNGTTGDVVTIDEFYSPTREITIARDVCSPTNGSFVAAHRYYFDTNTRTWMVEVPAYTGQSERDGSTYSVPASTKAADISNNTMGGLHMLGAGCSGYVIPLSAKNFVIFSFNSRNVGPYYGNIAKTITATDPAVATPVSPNEQIQTITKAGVLLGAIGTKVGQWYVTSERVYTLTGDIVAGANLSTFRLVSTYSDGSAGTPYATDGVRVYSAWSAETPALHGADPATFIAIRQQYQIPYASSSGRYGESFVAYDNSFAKDKSYVWYQGRLIPNANPNSFVVIGNTHVENATGGYTLAQDAYHTYGIDKQGKLTIDGITIQ